MNWWFSDLFHTDKALLISWVFWVIFSICLHELGHGLEAMRRGDTTPRDTGHMTWNPLVHMGYASLIVFALCGVAWGAMPVNMSRLRGRHGDAAVAAAGPAVNLLLAAICTVLLAIWKKYASGMDQTVFENFSTFFLAGAFLNLVLMALNLLPLPPLDGSRVVGSFSPGYRSLLSQPNAEVFGLILVVIAFRYVSSPVMDAAARTIKAAIGVINGVLP